MRPRQGRWLTGVCKGIALHLGIGVAWVRIAFIALTVLYGAGIIAYVFLWVFMPAGDPVAAAARTVPVNQAPLARGNQPLAAHDDESAAAPESLSEADVYKRQPDNWTGLLRNQQSGFSFPVPTIKPSDRTAVNNPPHTATNHITASPRICWRTTVIYRSNQSIAALFL